jgi:hypothetical protein
MINENMPHGIFTRQKNSLVDYLNSKMGNGDTILSDAKKIIVAHRNACPLHHVKGGASSPMCTSTDNSEIMVTCVLVDGFCIGKEY